MYGRILGGDASGVVGVSTDEEKGIESLECLLEIVDTGTAEHVGKYLISLSPM